MKREIKYIVVHCTATPTTTTIKSIERYWKVTLGWANPGYHYIIERNGVLVNLLPEDEIANGVKGYNKNAIHISYIGGIDADGRPVDNRTDAQKRIMWEWLLLHQEKYPGATILGHRDFPGVTKSCPSFDVREWMKCWEKNNGQDLIAKE
ncbi:N-acetylmuramoyl-L-alanine amidase [Niabella pedocola]|uniref:N-acetylmuramoyl-L-alanine amidase n=1 Tax=Niabella pedocola TaxID=1752077 RepID=A0ABS8PUB3_9BACT|nr:N-acetylmuramoyl-L-alanine amidase [Niabella pedocola]MCD2424480.1 N-acetylmuramoyl-L-alanine amidase [Niabella pedocola]